MVSLFLLKLTFNPHVQQPALDKSQNLTRHESLTTDN